MNLLMLASELYPVRGGAGAYVAQIAENLPNSVMCHVLTPARVRLGRHTVTREEVQPALPPNVRVHYVGEAKNAFLYNLAFQVRCRRILPSVVKAWNIDLIHSQSALPDLFVSPDSLRVPIVTTIHTTIEGQIKAVRSSESDFLKLESSERMTLLLGPLLRRVEDRYYKRNRYFITVSKWAKNEFINEKEIEADRIAVIPNGIDVDRFASVTDITAEQCFPELADMPSPKVLYFSRLVDKKGISFLMKAIPQILDQNDVHFIFAGVGRELKFDIPRDRCTYLGYVEESKKPCLYALTDMFVLPSLYENCPISILEAMASGNAVIATSVGGIPELIKHRQNGLLIQPKSDVDIVEAVTMLVEDERMRERLSMNAKTTVATSFSTNSTVAKTLSYYDQVLASYGASQATRGK